jgi:hypothetical protein
MQGKKGLLAALAVVAVLLLGVAGYLGLVYYSSHSLKAKVDSFIDQMKDEAHVSYKGLTTRPFAGALDISEMTITPKDKSGTLKVKEVTLYGKAGAGLKAEPKGVLLKNIEFASADKEKGSPVVIKEVEVSDMVMSGDICVKSTSNIRGITIDSKNLNKKDREEFKQLFSSDTLQIDGVLHHDYAAEKKELQERILINTKGLGELTLNLRLGNLDYTKFASKDWKKNKDPLQMLTVAAEWSIINLELAYKNAGLVENILKFAAQKKGQDATELVQTTLQQLDEAKQLTKMLGNLPPQVESSLHAGVDALKKFIQQPKSLKLTIAPAKPVVIGSIMGAANNPGKFLQELNISLTADGS